MTCHLIRKVKIHKDGLEASSRALRTFLYVENAASWPMCHQARNISQATTCVDHRGTRKLSKE